MPSRRTFITGLAATVGALTNLGRAGAAVGRPRRGGATLNVSRDMRAFGFANMTPDDAGVNATAILNAAIGLAEPNGIATIVADPGTYYLSLTTPAEGVPYYVVLNGANGLTIDLQGSSVIAVGVEGNAQAMASALQAFNCTGLTLANFSLDYDPLPFSQFTVVTPPGPGVTVNGTTSGTAVVTTQPGFQGLSAFSSAPGGSLYGFVFRDGARLYAAYRFDVSVEATTPTGGTVTLSTTPFPGGLALLQSGDVLVIAFRVPSEAAALAFFAPAGLTLQNVSIYSSGAVGVYASAASGCVFSGISVVPAPGTPRLVSTNADGISLGQAGPNNQIVGCTFDSVQDDSVSVNSLTLGAISNDVGPGSTSITLSGGQAGVTGVSTVLFVDPATCLVYGPPVAVTPAPDGRLTLGGPLPAGVSMNFLVFDADPAHRGAGLVVAGNRVVQSCFSRGMSFWGLSGVTVRGNYLNGTHTAGIDVLQKTAPGDWMCLPCDAVAVQGNLLENCNQGVTGPYEDAEEAGAILVNALDASYGAAAAPVHTDITVQANYVDATPGAGLALQSILTGSAGGNLVQLASPPVAATGNGPSFTLGSVTSDSAIQIAVSPVGGSVGDPVAPGANASATLLTSGPAPPGALTFLMVDGSGASLTPAVSGIWPNFQLIIPSTAVAGVAAVQISAAGAAVARGGMFVA